MFLRPRSIFTTIAVAFALLAPATTAVSVPNPQYQFTFLFPDGSSMANATVGVSLNPFDVPSAYHVPQLASGTALSDGSFGFNFWTDDSPDEYKDGLYEVGNEAGGPVLGELPIGQIPDIYQQPDLNFVNVTVHAVDPDHTWLARWHVTLPLKRTYQETLTANIDLSTDLPGAADLSSEVLVGGEGHISTCLPSTEPEGFDQMLLEIEHDPGVGSGAGEVVEENLRYCPVSVQPPTPGAYSGPGMVTPEECEPNQTMQDCVVQSKKRWTKIAELHASQGMSIMFDFVKGGSDTFTTALCDGGSGWYGCGTYGEHYQRTYGYKFGPREGVYHRQRFAHYYYEKHRDCYYAILAKTPDSSEYDGFYCVDSWKPMKYLDDASMRSNQEINQPPRNPNRSAKLCPVCSIRTGSTRQTWFTIGVKIGPITLGSTAGWSASTMTVWAGIPGCNRQRWLTGDTGLPSEAGRIYAYCE